MELYQLATLIVCAAIFGWIARNLTQDEKLIYTKKRYFPSFKVILILAVLFTISVDINLSSVLLSILIMIVFWDLDKIKFWKGKK
jgi:hypothetical protein